jgi:hypothetical protein
MSNTSRMPIFIWRPRGVLSEALVNKIIVFVREQEETLDRSFNRFTDLSALDAIDLNFDYVFHIALYRRLSYAGGKVKSAFYVSSSGRCALRQIARAPDGWFAAASICFY